MSGLLLERMKHIDGLANSNGIDGAIGVRVVTGDNLQHARTEPSQRFCFWMLLSLLSKRRASPTILLAAWGKLRTCSREFPTHVTPLRAAFKVPPLPVLW